MSVLVPTILTTSLDDIRAKLARIRGLVETVQIDVVDGEFAGPPTWPYSQGAAAFDAFMQSGEVLSDWGAFRYEMDLMVAHPQKVAGQWIERGANRILLHLASTPSLGAILDDLERRYGYQKGFAPDLLSVGVAIDLDTDLVLLEEHLSRIDYVQFMGTASVGKGGQPFDPRVLKKIETFRKLHREVLVQVDGGVSLQTAPALLAVGVNRLVAGSAFWKSADLKETLAAFEQLANTYGRYF